MAKKLTKYDVKRLFFYNQKTGDLMWLRPYGTTAKPGQIVGSSAVGAGYLLVKVKGVFYPVHRLAFLYMTGKHPEGEIDHINGNKSDNRWENLRDVTHQENCKNQITPKSNTSGVIGVFFNKKINKWYAQIKIDYKNRYLGQSDDFFEVVCLRKSAEVKFGFHKNHGRAA